MINNYTHQKELMQARLDIKTCETMFTNLIIEGTNCSPFEAKIINDIAKESFNVGEYSEKKTLLMGQLIWTAISSTEPAGKPLKNCRFKKIVITYIDKEDDEICNKYGIKAKRKAQISRMTAEAMDQGALLSQEDIAKILGNDVRTIRRDIKELKELGITVMTRGQQQDIGPGITHREKAVELFLKGLEPVEIGKTIKHTLKAVERYVDTFCRVIYCQKQLKNILQTALVIGISVSLVNKYLEIKDNFSLKEEYQDRIDAIEKRGKTYWDLIDFKKNVLQSKRRKS